METDTTRHFLIEKQAISSIYLDREVKLSIYLPPAAINLTDISLLLINDGQNLDEMEFDLILEKLYDNREITPLLCVGIHCGPDRKEEYGTTEILDYKGRGTKAAAYSDFVLQELIPFIRRSYSLYSFKEKCFCGFSLGALSALDLVWSHPEEFTKVGLFSGSLWWRSVSQHDAEFDERIHRIMHMKIRNGSYYAWLKFFFETGTMDETADRNGNGIIDAIDDTISLMEELALKGYNVETDMKYLQLEDGKHDVPTWAKAFPEFLSWGWGGKD